MRPMTVAVVERLERSELRRYFTDVFLRKLERDGASSSHVEIHSAAVEYLERFCKRPLSPADIDDELLTNFESYLWRQQVSDNRRRNLVEALGRIAWAYTPDAALHAKRCQRRPLPEPAPGTVRHFYETVYATRCLVGRTARYVDENRAAFWRLHEHYGRDLLLSEQTDDLAANHFRWLLDQGLRATTINTGHMAVWFATWREAHRQGLIDQPPTMRKLPTVEEEPDSWTPAEVTLLLNNAAAASPRPIDGIPAGDWWGALILVAWYTALRRRALMAICRDDFDLVTGWLRVPAKNMKTGRGQSFRVGPDAIDAVQKIWEPGRDLLFPYPHDKTTFYKQFRRIIDAAAVPIGKCHLGSLHRIRRSAATEAALKRGIAAAQTLLGHTSQRPTVRYLDPRRLPGNDFTDVLPQLLPRVPK